MMQNCPCCSGLSFQHCCEPYIKNIQTAPNPEALMRSRYTAYTLGNIDYIEHTMKGKALSNFDRAGTLHFARTSQWQGLDIVRGYQSSDSIGYVEFVAHYNDSKGHHQHMSELSEFHLEDGLWYYVDGKQKVHHHNHHSGKIGRNDPCPCNSGKKYKKCCGP